MATASDSDKNPSVKKVSPKTTTPKRTNASRLFGYDIFISFALGGPPRGTMSYASDLARRLREDDFTVFFSEDEAPPGSPLTPTLKKALGRSRSLLVVANKETLRNPRWVREETQQFKKQHPRRPVVPILATDVSQDKALLTESRNWLPLGDDIWVDESPKAIEDGLVSDSTLARIESVPKWQRSNVKWRWLSSMVITGLIILLVYANFQRIQAVAHAVEAVKQQGRAEEQTRIAQTEKDRATEQARIARMQQGFVQRRYAFNMWEQGKHLDAAAAIESAYSLFADTAPQETQLTDLFAQLMESTEPHPLMTFKPSPILVEASENLLKKHMEETMARMTNIDFLTAVNLEVLNRTLPALTQIVMDMGSLSTVSSDGDRITCVRAWPSGPINYEAFDSLSGRSLAAMIIDEEITGGRVRVSPNGKYGLVLSANPSVSNKLVALDLETGKRRYDIRDGKKIEDADVWINGDTLISRASTIEILSGEERTPRSIVRNQGRYAFARFCGAEDKIVVLSQTNIYSPKIGLINCADGHLIRDFDPADGYLISTLAVSPSGKYVAAASSEGRATVWVTDSGQILTVLTNTSSRITSLAFSADDTRIGLGYADGVVLVWNLKNEWQEWRFVWHDNAVSSICFWDNMDALITADTEGITRTWALGADREVVGRSSNFYDTNTDVSVSIDKIAVSPAGFFLGTSEAGRLQVRETGGGYLYDGTNTGWAFRQWLGFSTGAVKLVIVQDSLTNIVTHEVHLKRGRSVQQTKPVVSLSGLESSDSEMSSGVYLSAATGQRFASKSVALCPAHDLTAFSAESRMPGQSVISIRSGTNALATLTETGDVEWISFSSTGKTFHWQIGFKEIRTVGIKTNGVTTPSSVMIYGAGFTEGIPDRDGRYVLAYSVSGPPTLIDLERKELIKIFKTSCLRSAALRLKVSTTRACFWLVAVLRDYHLSTPGGCDNDRLSFLG